jgi:pimeloyl-ACP methyl ester carboxylesterase
VEIDAGEVGVAEFGDPRGVAVLWCHGGPGSRLEPRQFGPAAATAGLRLIGVDRPGYGRTPPQPGRTIAGWVPTALAVLDQLGVDRAVVVGHSTGGSYALAVAALAPERTRAVVLAGAMTDMADDEARATMSRPHALDVWEAPDRESAIAAATASHGIDGSGLREITSVLPPADLALFRNPARLAEMSAVLPEGFTFGLEGYADDRIADGGGWVDFDVTTIAAPVVVLHGSADPICRPIHARHTAELVPGAQLDLRDGLGHFSILDEIVPTVVALLGES